MNEYLSVKLKMLSFFSMVLVVFLHSYNLVVNLSSGSMAMDMGYSSFIQLFFSQGVARIAVPLFFSISGYLFFLNSTGLANDFFLKFKKRLRTLLIPFLFWSIFWILLFVILESIPKLSVFFTNKHIVTYSMKEVLTTIFINPIPHQLWFIRDLLVLVILSPVMYYLIKTFKYFPVIVFMIIWMYDLNLFFFSNESLLFFSFGSYLALEKKDFLLIKFSNDKLFYSLIWFAFLLFRTYLINSSFENEILIRFTHYINVLIGIFAVWSLYDLIVKNKDLTESKIFIVSNFTFFIYVFHDPMLSFIKKIFFYLMGYSEFLTLVVYILSPVITILLCILVGSFLRKFTSTFYTLICGGR